MAEHFDLKLNECRSKLLKDERCGRTRSMSFRNQIWLVATSLD